MPKEIITEEQRDARIKALKTKARADAAETKAQLLELGVASKKSPAPKQFQSQERRITQFSQPQPLNKLEKQYDQMQQQLNELSVYLKTQPQAPAQQGASVMTELQNLRERQNQLQMQVNQMQLQVVELLTQLRIQPMSEFMALSRLQTQQYMQPQPPLFAQPVIVQQPLPVQASVITQPIQPQTPEKTQPVQQPQVPVKTQAEDDPLDAIIQELTVELTGLKNQLAGQENEIKKNTKPERNKKRKNR